MSRAYLAISFLVLIIAAGCRRSDKPAPLAVPSRQELPPVLRTTDEPRVIVEKALQAYGGARTITRWRAGHIKYEMKGSFLGPLFPQDALLEEFFQYPGQFKRIGLSPRKGMETFVINGKEGWSLKPDGTRQPLPPKSMNAASMKLHPLAAFCTLAGLEFEGVKMSVVGTEQVEGHSVIVVKAWAAEDETMDYYFDLSTGLLVKLKRRIPRTLSEKEIIVETYLSDYRDIAGGKVPMKLMSRSGSKIVFEITMLDIQFLDKVDEVVFVRP